MFPIDLNQEFSQAMTGHFGLTIIRLEAVKRMPKPWFLSTTNDAGEWEDGPGRADADVGFWCMLNHVGGKVYQANRIRIGHMELTATWPTVDGRMVRRSIEDFAVNGVPKESLEQAGAGADASMPLSPGIQGEAA